MKTSDVRKKYLEFFKERGHAIIPSASIVPHNDPTTLFTGSGMQPLVPYLLGKKHPEGDRLTDSQKCFRAEDIEEVGDNRHTTFFEMLGNWSLGDYFKREQLPWVFEFLTEEIGLEPSKIYVTVFSGAQELGIPQDDESIEIWRELFANKGITAEFASVGSEEAGYELGMKEGERIFAYDAKKNWWSRAGVPSNMPEGEPGGPDSEVFYDFGTEHDTAFGKHCHPNCDCGRFLEIGNSVFMEYIKIASGFEKMKQQNVDFGGGLERIVAASNDDPDVFQIDSLRVLIDAIERQAGISYADNKEAYRVIADHVRGAVFMIADGVLPANTEQGYFARRLLRRAVRYADVLRLPAGFLETLAPAVIDSYKDHYAELSDKQGDIVSAVKDEEERFRQTLSRGMKEFEKYAATGALSGKDAFVLFSTYGFPLELTLELAGEKGITVDELAFKKEMEAHREESRAGAEQRFKGGLADSSQETTRLHTAHHLLLKALQMVLGEHVKQRGSNITALRLRIDFSHPDKLTDEQKAEVERIVNEQIDAGLPVLSTTMKREEAEKLNAEQEFGQKYPDEVTVYSIGPLGATPEDPRFTEAFSLEFCGGPHVSNTSEIAKSGHLKIQSEKSAAAGIRRIKAALAI